MSNPKPTPLDVLRDRLRSAGLRCTAARLTVLQHLVDNHGPKTHAEVCDALADRGFDKATIYRNLTELTDAGMLARVELGDHVWRFELRRADGAGGHEESHPHFVCTSCGEVSCLDDVTVEITPKEETPAPAGEGGREPEPQQAVGTRHDRKRVSEIPRVTEVLLKGRCGNCAEL